MNNRINSNDLLSFDFLHDNPDNSRFFKDNVVYNLNDFEEFKINSKLLEKETYENIEQHVKDIMFENFEHENHNIIYNYSNTNDNIIIKNNDKYILVFDNMQCNMKNILNIQMLLSNPTLYIYIPFILCCENININKKNNNDDNDENNGNENITNIQDSYNKLKNKIITNDKIKIIESNFYNEDGNLKEEYILESLLIGFDYKKNKLLNFRDLKSIEKVKILIPDLLDFFKLIFDFNDSQTDSFYKLKNIIKKIKLNDLSKIIKYKKIKKRKNELTKVEVDKFNEITNIMNNIRSIIYSMKEMRDWFYVKEIVKKNYDNTLEDNIIYCTSDSINLFRSILYNISTINLHNNNIKYITRYENINNKKYIIYKQISPSYYYKFNNNQQNYIKKITFNKINELETDIIKKEIIQNGGNTMTYVKLISNNLNRKKYIIKCYNMDYNKLRFELYQIINELEFYFAILIDDDYNSDEHFFEDLKNNNFKDYVVFFDQFYVFINKLIEFAKLYKIDDLKCVDYSCEKLSDNENNYIKQLTDDDSEYYDNLSNYKNKLNKIKSNLVDNINEIKSKIQCSKFYYDPEYKLTNDEYNFTVLLYYVVNSACEVSDRENLGYVLKMLLSEYDWKLFRNAFNIFYDNFFNYPNYIKGKFKFVETFDEDKYDYRTKIVYNEFYPDEYDLKPIEDFERKDIYSKYKLIQQFIKQNNL